MNTISFKVAGLHCEACVKIASSRFKKVPGVTEAEIELATGNAKVVSEADLDLDILRQSLEGTDYTIVN